MNVVSELEKFLLTTLAIDLDIKSIAPDEDLLTQGIIDSMGIMNLCAFMEENFRIDITEDDLVPENFQNIDCLKEFIELKQQI